MPVTDHAEQPTNAALTDLSEWLLLKALESMPFDKIFDVFCQQICAAGIPLQRSHITLRAHHPEFGSRAYRWHRDDGNEHLTFERRPDAPQDWLQSPLFYLLANDIPEIRQRLTDPNPVLSFPFFDDLRAIGTTDYFAAKRFFFERKGSLAVDPMDTPEGMVISFASDAPDGFADAHLDGFRQLLPALALTLKSGANRQMAEDITATYLGADAGRRVLSGDIMRGSSEMISAVIWYFDLRSFTKLSETLPGPAIIEMLNDYFGMVVALVERHGGNVLKFMGDGLLAIFSLNEANDARANAVDAALALEEEIAAVNQRREEAGLTITGFTLGLHAGDVLYGNIGGKDRLDFTVIGPAVNTTARILGMCSHVDQNIVISSDVALPIKEDCPELVSLGLYRLRGVSARQELFTLDSVTS